MPNIARPGLMVPAQLGPVSTIRSFSGKRRKKFFTVIISCVGMPSVIATQYFIPASAASMIESAAKAGGTKIMLASAPT